MTQSTRERLLDRLRDHATGALIAALYVLVLWCTARRLGFARDEGFYFHASTDYARWFDLLLHDRHAALTRQVIDQHWGYNHEHPALMKSLSALSWLFLHEKWHLITQESMAFRLPGMLMGAAALWVTYLFGARAYGRTAGVISALVLGLMPRVFYHCHLDCFDAPVMTLWVLVIYCYWRSLDGGWLFAALTGVTFGLALETKHNAWFLPFVVALHFFTTRTNDLGEGARRGSFPVPLSLVHMMVLGPAIFVGLWPWMWFDTFETPTHSTGRLSEYFAFHLHHAYYNIEFGGHNWFRPPFTRWYVPAMILFTVPLITLLLALVGLVARGRHIASELRGVLGALPFARRFSVISRYLEPSERDSPRATDVLVVLGMLVPLAPWLSSKTPIFGGTKHWFPAYPFLAILAGAGFAWTLSRLTLALGEKVRSERTPALALATLVLLPPLAQTTHSHPFGLSNYTPIIGGAPGAATWGLNRQFWGFTTGSLVPWFNQHCPQGGAVYIHDTTYESWNMLQRDEHLRRDINADWQVATPGHAIVHHELHMNEVDYQIWTAHQSPKVAHVLVYDGVPIVSVYAAPLSQGLHH